MIKEIDAAAKKHLHGLRSSARELGPEMERYLDYHFDRFAQLAGFVSDCLKMTGDEGRSIRLLDVGPSFQTMLFAKCWPRMTIDTLGLKDTKFPPPSGGQHIEFNLNHAFDVKSWPDNGGAYDIIVMAEVIEHLYTAPIHVLKYFNHMLRPGGILLVTTPNAVALPKRLRVLAGCNPSELIHEDLDSAGHFREYLAEELRVIGERAGFDTFRIWSGVSASTNSLSSRMYRFVAQVLPASLQKEFAIFYRKPIGNVSVRHGFCA